MKLIVLSSGIMLLTVSCTYQGKQAAYEMLHERERQECLKQGRFDCPKAEKYDKYQQQRDEVLKK